MDHKKRFISVIFLAVLILVILFVGFKNEGRGIDKDTYQAVFFANDQLYFGKLSEVSGQYLKLSDIYFLRDNGKDAKVPISLFKYGEEIHQPQDTMYINRDQVLLWQNLRPDGKVVQLIYQHKLQAAANPAAASAPVGN